MLRRASRHSRRRAPAARRLRQHRCGAGAVVPVDSAHRVGRYGEQRALRAVRGQFGAWSFVPQSRCRSSTPAGIARPCGWRRSIAIWRFASYDAPSRWRSVKSPTRLPIAALWTDDSTRNSRWSRRPPIVMAYCGARFSSGVDSYLPCPRFAALDVTRRSRSDQVRLARASNLVTLWHARWRLERGASALRTCTHQSPSFRVMCWSRRTTPYFTN